MSTITIRLSIGFILFTCLFACNNSNTSQDSSRVKEIMKTHEIKKISEVDILNKALEIGNELAKSSQRALSEKLMQSMKKNGAAESIKFCNEVASPVTDSLSSKYNASIKRTSNKLRNPRNQPDVIESQLLDAYQYSFDNQLELNESVQMLEDEKSVLFTKPIMLNNPTCLNCHGELNKNLKDENNVLLKSLYPSDSATGYKLNDFRGMWSIILDKKVIVNAL